MRLEILAKYCEALEKRRINSDKKKLTTFLRVDGILIEL